MQSQLVHDRPTKDFPLFCSTFTFQGLRIDEALRLYLEAFRLPGEAPVIQRLLETFTDNWHVRRMSCDHTSAWTHTSQNKPCVMYCSMVRYLRLPGYLRMVIKDMQVCTEYVRYAQNEIEF